MLYVTLLGSGGGMPMPNRFLSSLLINYESRKILIDCGEGTQVAMRKYKTGFKSLDIICFTHCHCDHIFGFPGLLSTIGNSERTEPITIIGPIGMKKIIEGMLVAMPYLPYDINIIECSSGSLRLDMSAKNLIVRDTSSKDCDNADNSGLILSILELNHSTPCLGYSFYLPRKPKFYPEKAIAAKIPIKYWSRLQNGETIEVGQNTYYPSMVLGKERIGIKLSYMVDTRPSNDIPSFIHQSDLFICEGTYGDSEDIEKPLKINT